MATERGYPYRCSHPLTIYMDIHTDIRADVRVEVSDNYGPFDKGILEKMFCWFSRTFNLEIVNTAG